MTCYDKMSSTNMTTKTTNEIEKLLLSNRQAAEVLSISPRTLWGLTSPRGPIPFLRIGNRTLYPYNLLKDWVEKSVGQSFHQSC